MGNFCSGLYYCWCDCWRRCGYKPIGTSDSGSRGSSARSSKVPNTTVQKIQEGKPNDQRRSPQEGRRKDVDPEKGPSNEDYKSPAPPRTSSVAERPQKEGQHKFREYDNNSNKIYPPIAIDAGLDIINETGKEIISKHEKINVWGIEGCNNSCYMDSSLNSMFLFTKNFIHVFETAASYTKELKYENANVEEALSKILQYDIVDPLNTHKRLDMKTEAMWKFRELLTHFNPKFNGNEMDPEEFISAVFGTILKIQEFYWIEGDDEGSYVFQTYADMTQPTDETDVQSLVNYSFTDSDIKLASIPKGGFIIKMPVTDGRHMFKKIYPNPEIELSSILGNEKGKSEFSTKMLLSAVICLSGNHFTTYLREEMKNDSPWWYLDSFQYSGGELIPEMDKTLKNFNTSMNDRHLSYMMSTCYMCFYLPQPLGRETNV